MTDWKREKSTYNPTQSCISHEVRELKTSFPKKYLLDQFWSVVTLVSIMEMLES